MTKEDYSKETSAHFPTIAERNEQHLAVGTTPPFPTLNLFLDILLSASLYITFFISPTKVSAALSR